MPYLRDIIQVWISFRYLPEGAIFTCGNLLGRIEERKHDRAVFYTIASDDQAQVHTTQLAMLDTWGDVAVQGALSRTGDFPWNVYTEDVPEGHCAFIGMLLWQRQGNYFQLLSVTGDEDFDRSIQEAPEGTRCTLLPVSWVPFVCSALGVETPALPVEISPVKNVGDTDMPPPHSDTIMASIPQFPVKVRRALATLAFPSLGYTEHTAPLKLLFWCPWDRLYAPTGAYLPNTGNNGRTLVEGFLAKWGIDKNQLGANFPLETYDKTTTFVAASTAVEEPAQEPEATVDTREWVNTEYQDYLGLWHSAQIDKRFANIALNVMTEAFVRRVYPEFNILNHKSSTTLFGPGLDYVGQQGYHGIFNSRGEDFANYVYGAFCELLGIQLDAEHLQFLKPCKGLEGTKKKVCKGCVQPTRPAIEVDASEDECWGSGSTLPVEISPVKEVVEATESAESAETEGAVMEFKECVFGQYNWSFKMDDANGDAIDASTWTGADFIESGIATRELLPQFVADERGAEFIEWLDKYFPGWDAGAEPAGAEPEPTEAEPTEAELDAIEAEEAAEADDNEEALSAEPVIGLEALCDAFPGDKMHILQIMSAINAMSDESWEALRNYLGIGASDAGEEGTTAG